MIAALGVRVRAWILAVDPWADVYGLARSILALGTTLTLLFSRPESLFHPVLGVVGDPPFHSDPLFELGLFCLFGPRALEAARWVAIVCLLVVASGWRPRWTGLLHSWISWSLVVNASLVDGGDQITSNIALLLVPVTLTDRRRWHWQASRERAGRPELQRRLIAHWFLFLIRVQVAVVYFHSAIAKFAVEEWADGTACYYWLEHPVFGTWMSPLVAPIIGNAVLVTAITWGTMLLEYFLSAAILLSPRRRLLLLPFGLALHAAILVFHGLVSFSIAMFAALLLYLWPLDRPLLKGIRSLFAGASKREPGTRAIRAATGRAAS